ncbi:MAG TPA: phosphoribosyltransferase family protein [Terriglobales bacterium]|nr:phosphoribosyltransferase family protein [Terriglobales bacterium]
MLAQGKQQFRQVITAEQIQKRVRELAKQISDDYQGHTIHVLAVLENSFVFAADLVREIETPLACAFVKPLYTQQETTVPGSPVLEIFFSNQLDIRAKDVLVIEALVHSGVTTDFLMADLRARGAASVRLVTLLDRQTARRVQLQPDYFGFLVDDSFLVGYGLGSAEQLYRNLPFVGAVPAKL